MIICNKYKFIFIKTRKTAGTSAEIALSRLCNSSDIVTKINIKDEEIRKIEGGRKGKDITDRFNNEKIFYNHVTANEIKKLIPLKVWNEYLKITIERNPWDKAISRYWWDRKGKNYFPSLSDYLQNLSQNKPEMLTNWNIYTINDTIVADKVIRYETIQDDFNEVARMLGVKNLSMPKTKAKGEWRKDRRPYREILSNADKMLIERLCNKEIVAFNYKY